MVQIKGALVVGHHLIGVVLQDEPEVQPGEVIQLINLVLIGRRAIAPIRERIPCAGRPCEADKSAKATVTEVLTRD